MRHTRHQVIVYSERTRLRKPRGELQQRIQGSSTRNVKVHVHTTMVIQHEVLQCIDTLYGVFVCIVRWYEPGVFGFDEGMRFGLVPDVYLEGRVELSAELRGIRARCSGERWCAVVTVVKVSEVDEVDGTRYQGRWEGDIVVKVEECLALRSRRIQRGNI